MMMFDKIESVIEITIRHDIGDGRTDWMYSYVLQDLPPEYQVMGEDQPHVGCFRINNRVEGWEFPDIHGTRSLSVGDIVEVCAYMKDDVLGYDVAGFEPNALECRRTLMDGEPWSITAWKVEPVGWKTILLAELDATLPGHI